MITAGVYIHFPFCRSKCAYCDFYSVAGREVQIDRYCHALIAEIMDAPDPPADWSIDTLFIGGGTPSLLTPEQLALIFSALRERFDLSALTEATLEANPGTVSPAGLRAYRAVGINRLSLGIQSFDDELLCFLGRGHSAAEACQAIEDARAAGFRNLNCDLIYGIPGQSRARWEHDLRTVLNYRPEHLACYSLTIEPETVLGARVRTGKVIPAAEDDLADMFLWTADFLREHGYQHYEISNFARPGRECAHNRHYWRIEPYFGFGPAAHSFDGRARRSNGRNLDHYLELSESGQPVTALAEVLTTAELTNEIIGCGLRLAEGFDLQRIDPALRQRVDWRVDHCLERWDGRLVRTGSQVVTTERGMLFADAIAADLIAY